MKSGEAPRRAGSVARGSMAPGARRVIYLTYDGLTDQLGRSQILPYLTELARRGHRIVVISCEKRERLLADGEAVGDICRRAGIDWHPLRYHKRPPVLSGIIDIVQMQRHAAKLFRAERFDLVHCRSYLTSLVGLSLKRRFGVPFLFDMRGFWADERIEMGLWPQRNPVYRAIYRFFKKQERRFLVEADAIVSLTDAARTEMSGWPLARSVADRIHVIPCCVDLDHFRYDNGALRVAGRKLLDLDDDVPLLVYVGSLGGTHLLDDMLRTFRHYRAVHPEARFLLITHHPASKVVGAAQANEVPADALIVRGATRDEVPLLIAAADLGIAFKRADFSSKACCPTKVGEMLAVGVPVIANSGVGDVRELIGKSGAGAVVSDFDDHTLVAAIAKVEAAGKTGEAIRALACRTLALQDGVDRYDAIYRSIGIGAK